MPDSSSMEVLWNGVGRKAIVSDRQDEGWQLITLRVRATDVQSTLGFRGAGQANELGAFIDDVSLKLVSAVVLDDEAQTTDVDPGVDAIGKESGPGDDQGAIASVSGKLLFNAGADGLGAITLNSVLGNGLALEAVFVDPTTGKGTTESVTAVWNEVTGDYIGKGSLSGQDVFTLHVEADGKYTFTLHAPLAHPGHDDLSSTQATTETEFEDNLNLTFNFSITDGDNDTAHGSFTLNVDDDTPDAAPASIEISSDPSTGSVTGNLNFHPGSDGWGSANLSGIRAGGSDLGRPACEILGQRRWPDDHRLYGQQCCGWRRWSGRSRQGLCPYGQSWRRYVAGR